MPSSCWKCKNLFLTTNPTHGLFCFASKDPRNLAEHWTWNMAYMSGCELITRNRCYYPNEKRCLLSGESGLTDSTALHSSHLHAVTFLWRVKLINVSRQPPNMDRERVSRKCFLCKGFRLCYQLPWKPLVIASVSVMRGRCGWFLRNLPPPPLLLTQDQCKHQVMQTELSPIITRDHTTIHPTISSTKVSGMWARVTQK